MRVALKTTETLSPLFPATQVVDLTPQQTQMLMGAQQLADNERSHADTTTTELFQEIGEKMGDRLVGLLKQIEALQTNLMQSQGQNQELQVTHNAQVVALQAQLATQQAEIATLRAQNARLQTESDQRIAAEIRAKTEAVTIARQPLDAHINSLTEQNQLLKTQAYHLQGQVNISSYKLDTIKHNIELVADRADKDSKLEYVSWASAHLFQVLQNELGQIAQDLRRFV